MLKAWTNPYESIPRVANNEEFYDIILSCFTTQEISNLSRLWKQLEGGYGA